MLREALLVAVALFPSFALVADGALLLALIALVPAALLLVLAHLPRVRAAHAGPAWLGVVGTVTWLTLLFHQDTERGGRSDSWLWVSLFGVAAAFAAFGSYYGVARAAESRSSKLRFLYRADLHPLLVLGIVHHLRGHRRGATHRRARPVPAARPRPLVAVRARTRSRGRSPPSSPD